MYFSLQNIMLTRFLLHPFYSLFFLLPIYSTLHSSFSQFIPLFIPPSPYTFYSPFFLLPFGHTSYSLLSVRPVFPCIPCSPIICIDFRLFFVQSLGSFADTSNSRKIYLTVGKYFQQQEVKQEDTSNSRKILLAVGSKTRRYIYRRFQWFNWSS